eukprot:3797046-Prymnesium_polylepis.1
MVAPSASVVEKCSKSAKPMLLNAPFVSPTQFFINTIHPGIDVLRDGQHSGPGFSGRRFRRHVSQTAAIAKRGPSRLAGAHT